MSLLPAFSRSLQLRRILPMKLPRDYFGSSLLERDRRDLLSLAAGRCPDYRATDGVAVVVETGVPTYRPWRHLMVHLGPSSYINPRLPSSRRRLSAGGEGAMAGDGVACLRCCGIPNGVARRDEALRTNGYNTTINLVTRDDEGVCQTRNGGSDGGLPQTRE